MKKKILIALPVFLLLTLLVATTVSAAVTWGTPFPPADTTPTWLNPGYEILVGINGLTAPHSNVCINYSVNGGAVQSNACTCSAPDCSGNVGTFHCVIPTNYSESLIAWNISGSSTATCGGNVYTTGQPSGSFSTQPNAVALASFEGNRSNLPITYVSLGLVAVIGMIVTGGLIWRSKARPAQNN